MGSLMNLIFEGSYDIWKTKIMASLGVFRDWESLIGDGFF